MLKLERRGMIEGELMAKLESEGREWRGESGSRFVALRFETDSRWLSSEKDRDTALDKAFSPG